VCKCNSRALCRIGDTGIRISMGNLRAVKIYASSYFISFFTLHDHILRATLKY